MMKIESYMDLKLLKNDEGGNKMMYVKMIWIWGKKEVYIMVMK